MKKDSKYLLIVVIIIFFIAIMMYGIPKYICSQIRQDVKYEQHKVNYQYTYGWKYKPSRDSLLLQDTRYQFVNDSIFQTHTYYKIKSTIKLTTKNKESDYVSIIYGDKEFIESKKCEEYNKAKKALENHKIKLIKQDSIKKARKREIRDIEKIKCE
jgi:hypothetical protein